MSYRSEFPDWDGGELYIPEGWKDNSWGQNTCPHAELYVEKGDIGFSFYIWQDYIDVNKREYDNTPRYTFEIDVKTIKGDYTLFFKQTDSLEEIKDLVKGVNDYL